MKMNTLGPKDILELARNFMESRILLSGAELGLFTLLCSTPLTAKEVAARIKADPRALTILLNALAAMELLTKKKEKFYCPSSVSVFLSAESPDSVLPMVLHAAHLWRRWSGLTPLVQGAPGQKDMVPLSGEPEELKAFIGAMHAIAAPLAPRIVKAVRPEASRALLDVGGASGTYTIAFLQAVPQMKATLFDKPAVVEMARERLKKAGLLDRVTLAAGDFYSDELPGNHDLAFFSAIIHQNSAEQNLTLFKKIFRALQPGGRIVIRDHIMDPARIQPRSGAVFAVNMLLATSGGNTYTFEEIEAGLAQAGFARIRLVQRGEQMDGLVDALKP
jgi:predicted O-methyltransferase YrrM